MSVSLFAGRIRPEDGGSVAERGAIRAVNEAAFGGREEADLVDQLRDGGTGLVSLVAEMDAAIVGYVLFSRMWIDTASGLVEAAALAPLAVHPDQQRCGIGKRLVARGLELLGEQGERIVIVVGHASYYPRFGFSAGKAAMLDGPFSSESFMAMELAEGALAGVAGRVIYPEPFGV